VRYDGLDCHRFMANHFHSPLVFNLDLVVLLGDRAGITPISDATCAAGSVTAVRRDQVTPL
jgi:hypothetical protein